MYLKAIPERTCIGCNEKKQKKELIRIVKDKEGNIRYLENKIKYYNELDYEEYIKYHNLANSAKEE